MNATYKKVVRLLTASLFVVTSAIVAEATVTFDWFKENPTSVTTALGNSGASGNGTWSVASGTLGTVLSSDGSVVTVDTEAGTGVAVGYVPTATVGGDVASVTINVCFSNSVDVSSVAVANVKAAIAIVKDAGAVLRFAYVANGAWVTNTTLTAAADTTYAVKLDFDYANNKVSYTIVGGDTIASNVTMASASTKVTTASFLGAGTFTLFNGTYDMNYAAAVISGSTTNYYNTFDVAFTAAVDGVSICLCDDVTWDASGVTVDTNALKTLNIDLNGHALDVTAAATKFGAKGYVCKVANNQLVTAIPFEGAGTEASPYLIADYDTIDLFKNGVNAGSYGKSGEFFKLTADIDFAGKAAWPGIAYATKWNDAAAEISTFGTKDVKIRRYGFCGTFDGDGHILKNVVFSKAAVDIWETTHADHDYCGFFNSIIDSTIKNLRISLGGANGWEGDATTGKIGGGVFAGVIYNSTLQSLATEASASIDTFQTTHATGGIVGMCYRNSLVKDCTNNLNITSSTTKFGGIACICEDVGTAINFQGCVNNGNLNAIAASKSAKDGVAGLIGYCKVNIKVSDFVNNGTITLTDATSAQIGNIAGNIANAGNIVATGVNKGLDDYRSVYGFACTNLKFAKVNEGVATYVDDTAVITGSTYLVTAPLASYDFNFDVPGTIAFDKSLYTTFAPTVTAAAGLTVASATAANVMTYTADYPQGSTQKPWKSGEGDVISVCTNGDEIVFSGTGATSDYSSTNPAWKDALGNVSEIKVESGVELGAGALKGATASQTLSFDDAEAAIAIAAFGSVIPGTVQVKVEESYVEPDKWLGDDSVEYDTISAAKTAGATTVTAVFKDMPVDNYLFNGYITNDWPNGGIMKGEWTNLTSTAEVTDLASYVGATADEIGHIEVVTGDNDTLGFAPTNKQSFAKGELVVTSEIKFSPVDYAELGAVPSDVKGVITLVEKEDTSLAYYGVIKDPAGTTNMWTELTKLGAGTEDEYVKVKISLETITNEVNVRYSVNASNTVAAAILVPNTNLVAVAYEGNGSVSELYGEFIQLWSVKMPDVENGSVSAYTNDVAIADGEKVFDGQMVKFVFEANEYYKIVGGSVVEVKASGEDVTVAQGKIPTIKELPNYTFDWNNSVSVKVTTNGTELAVEKDIRYTFIEGMTWTVTATTNANYVYLTEPEGWTLNEGIISQSGTVMDEPNRIYVPGANAIYTLKYEAGEGATGTAVTTNQIYGYEYEVIAKPADFEKTGCDFACWSNGTTGVTYEPGTMISNLTTTGGATVTLTAQWEVAGEAMYNGTLYATFGEAFNAATNNGTIKLIKNVVWDGAGAAGYKSVFIDLNGKLLDVSAATTAYAAKGLKCAYKDGKVVVDVPFAGEGTQGAPWKIASYDDIVLFKNGVNAGSYGTNGEYFVQTADIDFAGKAAWEGIGTYAKDKPALSLGFAANYDGGNFKISNLKFTNREYAGLFNEIGNLTADGTVKNLVIEDVSFADPTASNSGGAFLVGHLHRGLIENVTSKGSFGSSENPITSNAAGIVCRMNAGSVVSCTNEAAIYGKFTKVAGIVNIVQSEMNGYNGDSVISGCVNSGAISQSNRSSAYIGGIAAYITTQNYVEISGCVNSGVISSSVEGTIIGQIAGYIKADNVITSKVANVVRADTLAIGNHKAAFFNWATVENDVATLCLLSTNKIYRLMTPMATKEMALAIESNTWVAIDNQLYPTFSADGKIVANDTENCKIESATEGTVTTYTCVEIEWATLTVEKDAGVKSVTLTNSTYGIEVTAPYKADIDSNVVVSVNYELNEGYSLTNGCVVPESVTLDKDYLIAITTKVVVISIESKVQTVDNADVKVECISADGTETNDVTSTKAITYGWTARIVYTAKTGYQLSGQTEFVYEQVKTADDIAAYTKPTAQNEYKLIYVAGNGAEGKPVTNDCVYGAEYMVAAKPEDFAKAGYLFECWSNETTGVTYQPGVMVSNLTTEAGAEVYFTAAWTGNVHKVSIPLMSSDENPLYCTVSNMTDGVEIEVAYSSSGTNVYEVLDGTSVTIYYWTVEGYIVSGGRSKGLGAVTHDVNVVGLPKVKKNCLITVTPAEHTTYVVTNVSKKVNAQVYFPNNQTNLLEGTVFSVTATPDEGYAFENTDGWTKVGESVVTNVTVAKADITITIPAATANKYKLIYVAGNGAEGKPVTNDCFYGAEYSVAAKPEDFAKAGYLFECWSNETTGVTYQPGVMVSNLTTEAGAEIYFTAAWTGNVHKITIPVGTAHAPQYVVSNMTDNVAVEMASSHIGGVVYEVLDGTSVKIYYWAKDGYVLVGDAVKDLGEVTTDVSVSQQPQAMKNCLITVTPAEHTTYVVTNEGAQVYFDVNNQTNWLEETVFSVTAKPDEGYAFENTDGWTKVGETVVTNVTVLKADITITIPAVALTNVYFTVPAGKPVMVAVTNLTAGGALLETNELGQYTGKYFDNVKAEYTVPAGWTLVGEATAEDKLTNGVTFAERTATADQYTLAYKNGDATAFTEWLSEAPETEFSVTNDLTLATAAKVAQTNFIFNAWTNAQGNVVTTTKGTLEDLTVYAKVTALWSVKKPVVENATVDVYTNGVKLADDKKVIDGQNVDFVIVANENYVLSGTTNFTVKATADEVTVTTGLPTALAVVTYTFDYTNAVISVCTNSDVEVTLADDKATLIEGDSILIGLEPNEGYAFGEVAGWTTEGASITSNGTVGATSATLVLPRPSLTNVYFTVPVGEHVTVVVTNLTKGGAALTPVSDQYEATYFDNVKATYTADEGFTLINGDDQVNQMTNGAAFVEVTVAGNNYKVAYLPGEGADGTSFTNDAQYNVEFEVAGKGSDFAKTGYTFVGAWTNEEKKAGFTVGQTVSNLTTSGTYEMTALWKANDYEVKYVANGGTGDDVYTTNTYDKAFNVKGADVFAKTGYTYASWTNANGEVFAAGSSTNNLSTKESVTLYAAWTPNSYTLTYSAADGEGEDVVTNLIYDVVYTTISNEFTKTGYHFVSWTNATYTLSEGVAFSNLTAEVDGQVKLGAKWAANESYIKFSDGKDYALVIAGIEYGTEVATMPYNSGNFAHTGYDQVAWTNYEKQVGYGSGAKFVNDETVAGKTNTITAVYEANEYKLIYEAGEGTGLSITNDFVYDAEYVTSNGVFTKTGYTQTGWTNEVDNYSIVFGQSISNLTATAGAEVTFKAVYAANNYTLTYKAGKGTGDDIVTNLVYDVEYEAKENTFTRKGYSFESWTNAAGEAIYAGDAISNLTTVANGNVDFTAVWTANVYTVTYLTEDGAEFTEWAEGYTPPTKYTVEDTVTLPTAADVAQTNFIFEAWTNKNGKVVQFSNRSKNTTVAAKVTKLWSVKKPVVENATVEAYTNGTVKLAADEKVVDGATVKFVVEAKAGYELRGDKTEFEVTATANEVTVTETLPKSLEQYYVTVGEITPAGSMTYVVTNITMGGAQLSPTGEATQVYKVLSNDTVKVAFEATEGYTIFGAAETNLVGLASDATVTPPHCSDTPDYLSFEAVGGEVEIGMKAFNLNMLGTQSFEYAFDAENGPWTLFEVGYQFASNVVVAAGEKIYFRRHALDVTNTLSTADVAVNFTMTTNTVGTTVKAGGNVMSLLDQTCQATEVGVYAFANLFGNCDVLTEAPSLPATTLGDSCYYFMFKGCSALTNAPALPAEELSNACYCSMFSGCSSLTTAPELLAKTTKAMCYLSMFTNCSKLDTVQIAATNVDNSACAAWLSKVAAQGTIYCPAEFVAAAPRNASGIPANWLINPVKVTVPVIANASVDVTNDTESCEGEIKYLGNGEYLVSSNATVVITVDADEGYMFDDGADSYIETITGIEDDYNFVFTKKVCRKYVVTIPNGGVLENMSYAVYTNGENEVEGEEGRHNVFSNSNVKIVFEANEKYELVGGKEEIEIDAISNDYTVAAGDIPKAFKLFDITMPLITNGLHMVVSNDIYGVMDVTNGEIKAGLVYTVRTNSTTKFTFTALPGFEIVGEYDPYIIDLNNIDMDYTLRFRDMPVVTDTLKLSIIDRDNLTIVVSNNSVDVTQSLQYNEGYWQLSMHGGDQLVIHYIPDEGYSLDGNGTYVTTVSTSITLGDNDVPTAKETVANYRVNNGEWIDTWSAEKAIKALVETRDYPCEAEFVKGTASSTTYPAGFGYEFGDGATIAVDPTTDLPTVTLAGDGLVIKATIEGDKHYIVNSDVLIASDKALTGNFGISIEIDGNLKVTNDFTFADGLATNMLVVTGDIIVENDAQIFMPAAAKGVVYASSDEFVEFFETDRGYSPKAEESGEGYVYTIIQDGVMVYEDDEGMQVVYVMDDSVESLIEYVKELSAADAWFYGKLIFNDEVTYNNTTYPAGSTQEFVGLGSLYVSIPDGDNFIDHDNVDGNANIIIDALGAKVTLGGNMICAGVDYDYEYENDASYYMVRSESVAIDGDITIGEKEGDPAQPHRGAELILLSYDIGFVGDAKIKLLANGVLRSSATLPEGRVVAAEAGYTVSKRWEAYNYAPEGGTWTYRAVLAAVSIDLVVGVSTNVDVSAVDVNVLSPMAEVNDMLSKQAKLDAYKQMFDVVTEQSGPVVNVRLEFSNAARDDVDAAILAALEKIANSAEVRKLGKVKLSTKPGLYYAVYATEDIENKPFERIGAWTLGMGEVIYLPFEDGDTFNKRIYTIKVNYKPEEPETID